MRLLVIDRQKWLRGNALTSTLLNDNGCMCCLGFEAKACGVPESVMRNVPTPAGLLNELKFTGEIDKIKHLVDNIAYYSTIAAGEESYFSIQAMAINDNDYINDTTREQRLTELFASQDIELKFEN